MKILYLCPDLGIPVLGRKGASIHVRELVAAFERAGHDVVLAAQTLSKSPWELPAQVLKPPLQIKPASAALNAAQSLKQFNDLLGVQNSLPGELRRILYNQELQAELSRRFEGEPPDFVYERGSLYGTAGVTIAKTLRVPLLLELNAPLAAEQATYRATGFGDLAAHAERWTLTHADAVLVVSGVLREHALNLGVKAERIHVIPNGVDANQFVPGHPDPEIRTRWGLNGARVLGFIGGLRPWHGVEVLPELLQRLSKRHADIRLVVAGDGQLRGALEQDFQRRGLGDQVVYTGTMPHNEVPRLLRIFDIALAPYPALEHAFYFSPLKLFEYMACGKAVVAPALGQIAELVTNGETGILYPPGNLDALESACDQLLANPALRASIGQAASTFVRGRFTWDRNAAQVTALAGRLRAESQV